MTTDLELQQYLAPTEYVDSAAPGVAAFAREVVGAESDLPARTVRLYYAVRTRPRAPHARRLRPARAACR